MRLEVCTFCVEVVGQRQMFSEAMVDLPRASHETRANVHVYIKAVAIETTANVSSLWGRTIVPVQDIQLRYLMLQSCSYVLI